jgi:hypothetical protein
MNKTTTHIILYTDIQGIVEEELERYKKKRTVKRERNN